MILQLSNPLFVSKIIELAKVVLGTPLDVLEKMLLSSINDKDAAIFIDEKDGEVNGFILVSQETWEGQPVAFIQFCVIKPNAEEKYIGFELLTKVKLWAKERNLKDIITVVRRNPTGFCRKYRFSIEGTVLKRELVPPERGGDNSFNNLGIACNTCNVKKGRKTYEEFLCLQRSVL